MREAASRGHEVHGLDLKPSKPELEGFTECACDVTSPNDVKRAFEAVRPEAVVHCAAALAQFVRNEERMHHVNVMGTRNVLKAAQDAGASRFVFLSSVEVYGVNVPVPCPEDAPLRPVCRYGRDKLESERDCHQAAEESGLQVVVFRPPTISGPGQNEPSLLGHVKAAHRGKGVLLPGGGRTRLQMVDVRDACDAILRALEVPAAVGETFNLGSDDVPPFREVVKALYDRAGKDPKIRSLNPRLARFLVRVLHKLRLSPVEPQHLEIVLRDYVFDASKAKRVLGWRPKRGDVQSAVDTYDWYVTEVLGEAPSGEG